MIYTIYIVTHKVSGKSYVGATGQKVEDRWKEHKKNARLGSMHPFHVDLHDDGADAFVWDTLETHVEVQEAKDAEIFLIAYFKYLGADLYNEEGSGGEGLIDEEGRRALSIAVKAGMAAMTDENKSTMSAEDKAAHASATKAGIAAMTDENKSTMLKKRGPAIAAGHARQSPEEKAAWAANHSATMMGKEPWNKGKVCPTMSAGMKGRKRGPQSPEHIAARSAATTAWWARRKAQDKSE